MGVPTDAQLTFADHMGRFYARRYAFPPMVGRLIGYLAVCDPPAQSIGDLAESLLASRSAIANAVKVLETSHVVRRTRIAGERHDRVRLDMSSPEALGMDISEYRELGRWREKAWSCCARRPTTSGASHGGRGVRRVPHGAGPADGAGV